eukprot:TRINITY_DN16190_c0_g1_i1.p1 TRINITY_DN16190_c0_g1~~TRINITY_DN16190_c0_g1_i1.p1  ORF type:complete len:383 (+),score=64.46 TRINITY_DN16190_c0_g1_i1:75-1223(+)
MGKYDPADPLGIKGKLDMSLDDMIGSSKGRKRAERGERERPQKSIVGSNRVFVGNLAYSVTWQDLKDVMRDAGDVLKVDIIPERGTALGSKGCAIVEFATIRDARQAIKELQDTELKGRQMFLREDREDKTEFRTTPEDAKGRGRGKYVAKRPPLRGGYRSEDDSESSSDDGEWSRSRSRQRGYRAGAEGCRVYVGNLPFKATWKDLKDHFRQAGTVVHADVMQERGTAMNSKGCGIVEFASPKDAARAIRDLHDSEILGRLIFVREDRDKGKGSGKGKRARSPERFQPRYRERRDHDSESASRVFVGNLPFSTTWQRLKDFMRQAGDVIHADIMGEPGTPLGSKGCALVEYARPQDARRAIRELHDKKLDGRPLLVREDRE